MGIETLVRASLFANAAGGLMQAGGAKAAGSAQARNAMYQAQVATNNAAEAQKQAMLLRQQGQEAVQEEGQKVGQKLGAQRAAYAAAGVDVNQGTPTDVYASTAQAGRLDELRIYANAMQSAHAADVQSANYQNEANLDVMRGKQAKLAGDVSALGSLVSSAGSFSSKWAGFARTGAIPSWSD